MSDLRRDVAKLVQRLETEHGCTVRLTGGGHWRVSLPGHSAITMSQTPGDRRTMDNIRGDVRRQWGIRLAK